MNTSKQARFNEKYAETIPADELLIHEAGLAVARNIRSIGLAKLFALVSGNDDILINARSNDTDEFISTTKAEMGKTIGVNPKRVKVITVSEKLLSELTGLNDAQELYDPETRHEIVSGDRTAEDQLTAAEEFSS